MLKNLLFAAAVCAPTFSAHAESASFEVWDSDPVRWAKGKFAFGADPLLLWDPRTGATSELEEKDPAASAALDNAIDLAPSRTSPDGKSKASLVLLSPKVPGTWKDATFSPSGPTGAELRVERDGKSRLSSLHDGTLVEAMTYWSPDGRYVAWLLFSTDFNGWEGTRRARVLVGAAGGARTQVLAAQAVLSKGSGALLAAVEKAGLTPVFVGKAKKERSASVVYAAPGFEADAKKLAALVPGGATVEPLSWDSGSDLVLAGGTAVLGGAR